LLPSSVVRKMRDNPRSRCETRLVVALVLDLCNFTKISTSCTPLELIGYINAIFSAFDRKVKKLGLFKMDTIGDAYVAAGWLDSLDPAEASKRCTDMIRLSQRMIKVLERHREFSGKDLRCRIGISKGVVYAGVLGHLQPRYHLFGSPVREAEGLESRCEVDGVHVSASVLKALSSQPGSGSKAQGFTGGFFVRARSAGDFRVERTRTMTRNATSDPSYVEDVTPTRTPSEAFRRVHSLQSRSRKQRPSAAAPAAGLALVDRVQLSEQINPKP